MKKVVLNITYGGFNPSDATIRLYSLRKKLNLVQEDGIWYKEYIKNSCYFDKWHIKRDDGHLVRIVEELGTLASAEGAKLVVVEVPDNVKYVIGDDDGMEYICIYE